MSRSFIVSPASAECLLDACRALVLSRPSAERDERALNFFSLFSTGDLDPAGFFVAQDTGGVIRGAMLGQAMAGAVGLVWPPGLAEGAPAIEDALVLAVLAYLRTRGSKVLQAFPKCGDRAGIAPLERHGFRPITQLSIWRRSLARDGVFVPTSLSFDLVNGLEVGPFVDTLLATYEGSLDCPESNGPRTPLELVAGLGPTPNGKPLWFLARSGREAAGVVMLAQGEAEGMGDLSYLGLAPPFRGRGLGKELMRFALAQAAAVGFDTLTVSVDARNAPAVELYRAHGFRPHEYRDVYLNIAREPQ